MVEWPVSIWPVFRKNNDGARVAPVRRTNPWALRPVETTNLELRVKLPVMLAAIAATAVVVLIVALVKL
jgi:hypothetical protein